MRQLSNGYGFIHNQRENESYVLTPPGLVEWKKSNQTIESARKLTKEGLGSVLSAEQMQSLTELTKGHGLLGP